MGRNFFPMAFFPQEKIESRGVIHITYTREIQGLISKETFFRCSWSPQLEWSFSPEMASRSLAGGVVTDEMPRESMGLDFYFVETWSRHILRHQVGGWGAIIEKLRVGHFFLAGGGAGGSRIVMRPSTDLTSERSP